MSLRFWILGLTIFALDQYTKLLAVQFLRLGEPVSVIPDLFNLTLVLNKGAAFGMFSSWPDMQRRLALGVVSFLALVVVFRFVLVEARGDRFSQGAITFIVAGALGNMIDRIRNDAVIDFLDFYWRHYHWPAFNVADSSICIGVAVLVVRMLWNPAGVSVKESGEIPVGSGSKSEDTAE